MRLANSAVNPTVGFAARGLLHQSDRKKGSKRMATKHEEQGGQRVLYGFWLSPFMSLVAQNAEGIRPRFLPSGFLAVCWSAIVPPTYGETRS